MKKCKLSLALITMGIAAGIAHAEIIHIAMHNGATTIGDFDTAIDGTVVSAGSNGSDIWNHVNKAVDTESFSNKALLLDDGTASGASLASSTAYGSFVSGLDKSNDDGVMMTGWYGFFSTESMTVSSLSEAFTSEGYNVTIYGNIANRTMEYTIGGTTNTIDSTAKFDGTFVEGEDFVTFTGLTGTDFTITGNSGVGRSAISGITITSIPEPATLGLVASFGAGVLFIRRRFMI